MPLRKGKAVWQGNLKQGKGRIALGSGAFEGPVSFASRFEDGEGTNPEELIGAAHAACFSMALAYMLGESGFNPENIETSASVKIENVAGNYKITDIELDVKARVPEIKRGDFEKYAGQAKENCPVSQALKGVKISLRSSLES